MTKATEWPCAGCGAPLSGRGGRRYCGPDCRPRCSVDGCEKPEHSKGWCSAHATRAARYGDPSAPRVRQSNFAAPRKPREKATPKTCGVDGCDSPSRKRGWCASHYAQWRSSGEVKPFAHKWAEPGGACVVCGEPVQPGTGRRKHCSAGCQVADSRSGGDRPSEAICKFCDEPFSLVARTKNGRLQRLDTVWCPDCGRTSPHVQRFRRYGITKDFWETESAKGCQICGTTTGTLHVDHDHSCCPGQKRCCGECVRGLLCGPCNRGIGLLRDDYERVAKAAAYLAQFLNP